MPTTPKYALPYPGLTDAPNGPNAVQALAVAVDALPLPKAAGSVTVTCTTPSVAESVAVTFPVGAFSAPPIVLVSLATGLSGTITAFAWPGAVTASGFSMFLLRSSTTATAINWIAIRV